MDDLMNRTVIDCPVATCTWDYEIARARVEDRDGRPTLVLPPPKGVAPAEAVAGVQAARPVMAVPPPLDEGIMGVVNLARTASNAQDEGVLRQHLRGHSEAELAEAFGPNLERVRGLLAADLHPPVTVTLNGDKPRLVAYWVEDGPASGYRCSTCRGVWADADDMANHFLDKHVFVTAGVRLRPTS